MGRLNPQARFDLIVDIVRIVMLAMVEIASFLR
jgi:hypothetical protein